MFLILGVTASGKGRLAFELAKNGVGPAKAEIISIDSMKVYRRMDIGTAKPPPAARKIIKYHLIDIVEPNRSYNVGMFVEQASKVIEQIKARNNTIIAVGGTALYIKALLYGLFEGPGSDEQVRAELKECQKAEGLQELHRELTRIDPEAAERIDINDSRRIIRALEVYKITGKSISSFQQQWTNLTPKQDWTIIGLRRQKADAGSRINKRVKKMITDGLIDEVKALLAEEKPLSKQARSAIGYAEIIDYLKGLQNLDKAVEFIKKNTRQLAKHQRTWFKTFQKVHWLDIEKDEPAEQILSRTRGLLNSLGS
jgi:tRNA dimethylallyltransferase